MHIEHAYYLGASGEEAASRLLAASQIGNHLEPIFILAVSPITFVELRRRLISRTENLIRLSPSPGIFADLEKLAEKDGSMVRRVVWIESGIWDGSTWKETLVVLNRLRDRLHERFPWMLVFAGPLFEGPNNLANLCARHAPDFYSIAALLLIKEQPVPLRLGMPAASQAQTSPTGPNDFELVLRIHRDGEVAELSLKNAEGQELAWHLVHASVLASITDFFRPGPEEPGMIQMGVVIAEKFLGPQIFPALAESKVPRTLRILLPNIEHSEKQIFLAATLARVPWELARLTAETETLINRNLMVRLITPGPTVLSPSLEFRPDQELRVLLVFSDPGGHLHLDEERRDLLSVFTREPWQNRGVVVDTLIHGVTRERLSDQIRSRGGYHLVHWSGHGASNEIFLERPSAQYNTLTHDLLTGHDLLELFLDAFAELPLFFFLSTSESGALNFRSNTGTTGTTGTAYTLVQGGVTTVVAMRSNLSDRFARELSLLFYRLLCDETKSLTVAEALLLARKTLAADNELLMDYAAPVIYGEDFQLSPHRPGL